MERQAAAVGRRSAIAILAAVVPVGAVLLLVVGGGEQDPHLEAARALSDEQLAGQRVVASYSGSSPPKRLIRLIRSGHIAGVIFFASNVAGRRDLRADARRLQRARRRSSLPPALRTPLLLMVDQEGGEVRRLPGPPTRSQAEIGNSPRRRAAARKAGRAAARNVARFGLNVNLAPVLDVERRGGGALARDERLYGHRPSAVGALGAAFIKAQQGAGVAATAKHFPGLGAARVSTDDAAVRIDTGKRELRETDEAPYRPAVDAGVRIVMLSNAFYPAYDRRRPAGLSPEVIDDELRGRLGFEGVTVTDALEVPALGAFGPAPERGLRAASAGADLLLFAGQRVDSARSAWKRLVKALRRGQLNREHAVGSAGRVLELRAWLAQQGSE